MNSLSLHRIGCKPWRRRFGTNGTPAAWRTIAYRRPKGDLELAATIGVDGDQLLAAIDAAVEQPWLAQSPAIHVLRKVWTAQYINVDGQLRWRTIQERPTAAEQISSPYDPEARYGKKRDISCVGYKTHLTETCDAETPHVITNVGTTPAATPLTVVKSELLPSEHLVDMGYTGCRLLFDSQQRHGVVVVGPVVADMSWQAHAAEGFSKADFHVDWDAPLAQSAAACAPTTWMIGASIWMDDAGVDRPATPCPQWRPPRHHRFPRLRRRPARLR
jgi:transposase